MPQYDYVSMHVPIFRVDEVVHEREREGWKLVSTLPVVDPTVMHLNMGLTITRPLEDTGKLLQSKPVALLFKREH